MLRHFCFWVLHSKQSKQKITSIKLPYRADYLSIRVWYVMIGGKSDNRNKIIIVKLLYFSLYSQSKKKKKEIKSLFEVGHCFLKSSLNILF